MYLGTRAQVLLGVGEEIMRASSDQVRATDLRVRNLKLRITRAAAGTYELVRCEKISVSLFQR
jgi:hypothetical protein